MPKAPREGGRKASPTERIKRKPRPSERRRRTRRRDDRHHRDLVAAAADWLWECDADGRVDFLSPEFEASTGVSPQLLLGQRLSELASLAPAGSAVPSEQCAAIGAAKPFRDFVFELPRKCGPAAWLEIAGTAVFDRDRFSGYCGLGKTVTVRVEADLALQRYRQLFEVASDWFWETDADNRLVYVSPNSEAVLGLPPSAYYGKRLAEIEGVVIDPEAGRASIAAVKARQPYADFIYSQKLPNGKTIWINSSGAPFYGRGGVFLGYRGIARNVTAQVDAERAVREREQQFREMLEAAADYYWENDTQNRYTYLSPGFEKLLGISVTEMVGKGITDIPGVSVDPETARMGLQAKKLRQPFRDFVFSRKCADGKLRWFKTSGAAKFNVDGTFTGYRGVGAEITAHVEANQAARLGQQRLHEAVAHILQPLVIYDTEDRVVAFNQVFFDLLRAPNGDYARIGQGISFREITEWQLSHGFYTNGPNEPAVDLNTLLARYQSESEHTYHLRDDRWMLVVHRGLPGGGRLGLWTDITAVKRTEAEHRAFQHQLNHSQRLEALGTLAGGAAHEINNALVPVIALTKMMAAKQPEGSRERRNLDTVLTGAERSRDLVKQILAFSRKDDSEVRRDGVDLVAVLRDALKLMRATVPTSIALAEEITPAPLVAGDSNRLHQVIVNLVTNAAQAIGEAHGTITVGLRRDGDGAARFWVMDTGCGMNEATKARIFEPFFTTKAVGKGTGLGLSVVHGIIKEHGGRIEVESTPGRGTRFDVVLPAQTEQAGAAA